MNPDDRHDPLHVNGGEALAASLDTLRDICGPRVARGWATVELDRAEQEVGALFAPHGHPAVRPADEDELLNAQARLVEFGDGFLVVLLEPATEGRLAASLARFGEGFCAVYVLVAAGKLDRAVERSRAAGLRLSGEATGPFGRCRLVGDGPAWGGYLVLTEAALAVEAARAGTIRP